MKKLWDSWLKESIFIYSVIYTTVTIINSIAYLLQGVRNDPSGNWHELTRAMIVFIGVLAYELARCLPVKNRLLRTAAVYVITLPCALLAVWSTQFAEPLAKSAYRDIFVNYTGLFLLCAVITVLMQRKRQRSQV